MDPGSSSREGGPNIPCFGAMERRCAVIGWDRRAGIFFYLIPVAKLKLSEMKYFLKGCGVKLQRIIGAGEGNHVR